MRKRIKYFLIHHLKWAGWKVKLTMYVLEVLWHCVIKPLWKGRVLQHEENNKISHLSAKYRTLANKQESLLSAYSKLFPGGMRKHAAKAESASQRSKRR